MLQPKIVLAPVDFSEPSRDALETAADMASKFGATLVVVHVVAALPKLGTGVSIFKEGEYEHRLHEDAVQRVADLSAKYTQGGLPVRSAVGIANDVGMEIVRMAEHQEADLVVMATHGMTGWKALAFGSVTEKVVRVAPCAVLVLRAESEKR